MNQYKPKVSVCMITYGHEKYIHEAVIGVLNQTTSFEFELVISNDASPDDTDKIIREIIDTHPRGNIISYFLNNKNEGMQHNFYETLTKCKGKYIALCEGDDYWTDPNKLQKQVDLLENRLDLSLSAHNAIILKRIDTEEVFNKTNTTQLFSIEDVILKQWFIPTCSIVLRNDLLKPLPIWLAQVKHGDLSILLLAASKGKIHYDPTTMAVYRKHDGGVSANPNNSVKTIVETYNFFNKHSNYKYNAIINYRNYRLLINEAKTEPHIKLRFKKIQSAIKYKLPKKTSEIVELIKVVIK
jgi:glycosyltransferase involved in cell wall biosynthesis